MRGAFEHPGDKAELLLAEHAALEQIGAHLYRYLVYVVGAAVVVDPCVFERGARDEHQFEVVDLGCVVADDTLRAGGIFDIVQLEKRVDVDRKVERGLMSFEHGETLLAADGRYLGKDRAYHLSADCTMRLKSESISTSSREAKRRMSSAEAWPG